MHVPVWNNLPPKLFYCNELANIDQSCPGIYKNNYYTRLIIARWHENANEVKCKYILFLVRDKSYFIKSQSKSYSKYIQNEVIHMLDFLIGNILFQSEGLVFQQTICIPVGTNCIPLLDDLLLYA